MGPVIKKFKKRLIYFIVRFKIFNFLRSRYLFFTHHRYLIRSFIYFRALELHLRNENINNTKNFHKTFKRYWVRSEKLGDKWWRTFFFLLKVNLKDQIKYKEFLETTKKLNYSSLSVYEWLELYNFCMFLKLTELGLIFRNLSVKASLEIKIKKNNPLNRFKFGALIELDQYDQALDIIEFLPDNGFNVKQKKILIWLINLLKKGKNFQKNTFLDDNHLESNKLLSSKSIAIVANRDTEVDISGELKKFDLISRYNILDSEKFDFFKKGQRTDISFLVNVFQDISKDTKISNDIKSLVFYNYLKFKKNNSLNKTYISSYILENFTAKFLISAPMGQLRALLYLLMFAPKKIKVFNSDLLLTYRANKDYELNVHKKAKGYKRKFSNQGMFVNKCPFFDFIITKKLFKNKLIECDQVLSEILNFTPEEYAKRLQKTHFIPITDIRKNFHNLRR